MSKVVHLSDDAHNLAKDYCTKHGVKMSDWVAELIIRFTSGNAAQPRAAAAPAAQTRPAPAPSAPPPAAPQPTRQTAPTVRTPETVAGRSTVPKKKPMVRIEVKPQTDESGVPSYAAPPFWARAQKQ